MMVVVTAVLFPLTLGSFPLTLGSLQTGNSSNSFSLHALLFLRQYLPTTKRS